MSTLDLKVLEKLDKSDQEKITYFLKLLLNKSKYKKLKEEISWTFPQSQDKNQSYLSLVSFFKDKTLFPIVLALLDS